MRKTDWSWCNYVCVLSEVVPICCWLPAVSVALVFAANCSWVKSRGVLVCLRSRLCDSYKIGRDVTLCTRTWFVLYAHVVRVCVKLLRSTHACVLWYHGSVLQWGLIEDASMLYSALILVTLNTFSVVKSKLWVRTSSWCFYVLNASACTLTLFTFACCICVCM